MGPLYVVYMNGIDSKAPGFIVGLCGLEAGLFMGKICLRSSIPVHLVRESSLFSSSFTNLN